MGSSVVKGATTAANGQLKTDWSYKERRSGEPHACMQSLSGHDANDNHSAVVGAHSIHL